MNIQLIPIFFIISKQHCDDLERFKKDLKLVSASHYSINYDAKVPEGFNKSQLEISNEQNALDLLDVAREKSIEYWLEFKKNWLIEQKTSYVSVLRMQAKIEQPITKSNDETKEPWFLVIYEYSIPVMQFLIEETI